MESPQGSIMNHNDEYAASQTAHQIISILDRFIPDACRKEAWDQVVAASYTEGWELTSKHMRKEYEAWKALTLKGLEPSSPSIKPE